MALVVWAASPPIVACVSRRGAVTPRCAARASARLRGGGLRRLGRSARVPGAGSWLWVGARTSSLGRGRGARGGSEPGLVGPGCAAHRSSQSAPLSVVAEVTRQLLGRCPPAQLVDVLVFEDCLAIDGVLQPFELGLEVLESCLERLHPCPQATSGDRRLDRRPPALRHRRHIRLIRCVMVAGFGCAERELGAPRPMSRVPTAYAPDPL